MVYRGSAGSDLRTAIGVEKIFPMWVNPWPRGAESLGAGCTRCSNETKEGSIMNMIKRFINDESGATAIEYGLIAGLVAVAVIAALTALGGSLNNLFSDISDTVAASSS